MNYFRYLVIALRRFACDPQDRHISSRHMLAAAISIYARETSAKQAAQLCLTHLRTLERQEQREAS